jgi:hypothetical protein
MAKRYKRSQRIMPTRYNYSSWNHGKKEICKRTKVWDTVRSTIDRSCTSKKTVLRSRPERTMTWLKPSFGVSYNLRPWVSRVTNGISYTAAKALKRARPKNTITLQAVLNLCKGAKRPPALGFFAWVAKQPWLEKAETIRNGVIDRVRAACGGYTGTVVARLDSDVKRVQNNFDQEVTTMNIPAWAKEIVRFEHTSRPAEGIHFVAVVAGAKHPCNMNVPNGNFTGDRGSDFRNSEVNSDGVNTLFGNPGVKVGMPVGFRAAQFLSTRKGAFISAIAYNKRSLAVGSRSMMFPNIYPTQFLCDTLVRGESDRSTTSDEQKPDGDSRQIRESVREKLFAGESFEYSHGMRIIQVGDLSLDQILATPGVVDPRSGEATGRHFFICVARIATDKDVSLMSRGNANQYRMFCDELALWHIDPEAIDRQHVFGDTLSSMVLQGNLLQLFGVAKEPVAPVAEPVVPAPVAASVVVTPDPEPEVLETVVQPRASYAAQLEQYYDSTSLQGINHLSPDAITAEEAIRGFDVVSYPEENTKARQRLRILTNSSAAENVANAVRYYFVSHLTNNTFEGNVQALNFGDYPWAEEHVRDVVRIMQEVGRINHLKGLPEIQETDAGFIINFGEELGFMIEDNYAYDQRGRLLTGIIEMVINEQIVDGKLEVELAGIQHVSSITAFMRLIYFGYLALLVQSYTDTITSLSGNFAMFINDEYVTQNLVKFSKDVVRGQNAAALHRIRCEKSVLVHAKISPFEGKRWKTWGPEDGGGRFAKNITRRYDKATKSFNVREFWPELIRYAMEVYRLDYSYSKKVFVNGYLGHVRLDQVQKYLPDLFNEISSMHELDAKDIICASDKAAKGFKRVALPQAQSARVYGARLAGWELYRQGKPLEGSLQAVALLPTLVLPPGVSLWVGEDHERPVGMVDKTFKSYKINVEPDVRPSFGLGCAFIEGDYIEEEYHDVSGTWTQLTPKAETRIERSEFGDVTIAEVVVSGVKTFIKHESVYSGKLNWVRWRVRKNMQLSSPIYELDVVWNITTRESWPKVRSIAKAMLLGVDRSAVSLGPDRPVNLVHAQDGIKADTLYAWLMVIGNTLRYNWENPLLAEMRAEASKINALLGKPEYLGVVIELVTVTSGAYDRLQQLFAKIFGQVVSVYLKNVGDMGRMLYDMHQHDDYEMLPVDVYGEHVYVRKGDNPKLPKTNVTRFVLVDGVVTEVHQRCYGFASVPGCTLYNVELFESSTVMEAVSTSFMVPNAARAMTYTGGQQNNEVLERISMAFAKTMDDNLYRLKAMFQMYNGGTFNCPNVVEVVESNGLFCFNPQDYADIRHRLGRLGLKRFVRNQERMFEVISEEFADTVFVFIGMRGERFSIYMPAVRKFNKLSSSNEATETLSSVFFENAFKPMIVSMHGVPRVVISSVLGKLRTMVHSEESRKLLKGVNKVVARRTGMPSVPISETWLVYDEAPDSVYTLVSSYLKTMGVSMEVGKPYTCYNSRDPMVAGWFSDVIAFTPEELRAKGWYMGPHTFAVSPVASYIDGGDFDGDNHTITYTGPETASEVMTYERVMEIRNSAMGANMLHTGSYAFDHYTRKDFDKAARTLSSKAVSKAARTRDEYIQYNVGAHEVQNVAVGQCYKVCMIAENIIQLVKDFQRNNLPIPQQLEWAASDTANSLILATSEIYEIMLGGYSYEAFMLYNMCLIPAIREGKPFSSYLQTEEAHNAFRKVLEAYGANVGMYYDFLNAVDAVALTQSIQIKGKIPASLITQPDKLLVISAALVSFEVTRGRFRGFMGALGTYIKNNATSEGHYAAMRYTYEFIGNSMLSKPGYEPYNKLVRNSHVLVCLTRMFKQLDVEIGLIRPADWPAKPANSKEFLESFVEKNDKRDEDGGVPVATPEPKPTPMPPSDPIMETVSTISAEQDLSVAEQKLFEDLNEDQKRPLRSVLNGHNILITGEAGTGKTYLTQKIRNHFSAIGWDVVVMGSTGVSVMNIEGHGTFNSMLSLGLGFKRYGLSGEQASKIMASARSMPAYQNTITPSRNSKGLLIMVDEVSMLDTRLLGLGAELVAESGIKVQWVLVGDPGQCSPVDGELFFKDYQLEFPSGRRSYESLLKKGNFRCFALKEVVRQAEDHTFLHGLQALRNGQDMSPVIIQRFKESLSGTPEGAIHTFFNNECVRNFNRLRTQEMIDAGAEHRTYRAEVKRLNIYDDDAYARFLKWFDPIEEEMTLCVGMPVMLRSNIKDGMQLIAANGTVGTITDLQPSYVMVRIPGGAELMISKEEIDGPKTGAGKKLGIFKQLKLHPAFALTGHKLQGLTIKQPLVVHAYQKRRGVAAPVSCPGWLYVVCSRVTKSEHLYFDTTSPGATVMNLLNSVCVDREALTWVNELSSNQS